MISGLIGKLENNNITDIELNVNGVIYEVFISLKTNEVIKSMDKENIKLNIFQIFKEDSHNLYGFYSKNEKTLFINLLKINGIGPKVGMAICSSFEVFEFLDIVENIDIESIKKIPGIGPKTAGRLLVEFKDFNGIENSKGTEDLLFKEKQVAVQALSNLGFKKNNIEKILKDCIGKTSSELIKEVLKKIR